MILALNTSSRARFAVDSTAHRQTTPLFAAYKLSVDHSVFSVSTGSMLAARRAGT
jgi:hypothetical protein